MSKLSGRNTLLSMAGATAGVFLFAFSFCVFLRPLGLYSGGFTGIAQIIHLVFQDILKIPLPGGIDWTGIIFWMLNIPLFLLSYVLISHSFFYKKFYSFWLPFLFPNSDDLLAFCHSDKVHEVVNGWCNDLEMEMLGINNAGSRQISNSKKEITKPEDLKGMNIRVPGANIFIDLYRNYFGANPTAMDFSEVYTSLQQKTIDGQENPIAVFDSSKFAEVQQYVTLWDGVRDTTIWVMSRKTMNKLSPEDQELVKECAAEALDWGNDYLADNEAVIIQKLKDGGTVITELTEEQKAEFQKACAGIYDDYAKSVGQDVIDLFTGGYKN